MQLLISEKPSVGQIIAKVLGVKGRRDGYMEGGDWLISWCIGHLVEPAPPDSYDPRYSRWDYADLPIVPQEWKYQVMPQTKKQFDTLTTLMVDPRVDTIICATDAGREGELIFRYVYELCGCKKPVKRLWISSMEETSIRHGLDHLVDDSRYDRLYDAALCRAKADWLIGINGTRLFSILNGGKTLNVGRVITPTLALLTDREEAVAGFKKEKFYNVALNLDGFQALSPRFASRTEAEKVRVACAGKPVTVKSVERQERSERPPKLYDLTTLQREANRLFDYTAQETLDYLQAIYELRLSTYPRTDSRYLTEDMGDGLPPLCETVAKALPFARDRPLSVNPAPVLDSSKVSDHHAIIPTAEIAQVDLLALPSGERNILYMISVRLLCALGDPYLYSETAVTLECGGITFTRNGKAEISEGWKGTERAFFATLKKKPTEESATVLPELTEGQALGAADISIKEGTTRPPARFTEDTLLLAMERASAEDFAKLEEVERAGLGTPATRAGIIEKLIKSGMVVREKKQLAPTEQGMNLIRAVPPDLKSAKLTAEWEEKLCEVERGTLDPADFISGIVEMLEGIVRENKEAAAVTRQHIQRPVIGVCPRCGKNVVEGKKSFFCEGYYDNPSCGFALWKNSRFFADKKKELDKKTAIALLKHGRVRMTNLFSEKKGVLYDATVVMEDDGGKYVRFSLDIDRGKAG